MPFTLNDSLDSINPSNGRKTDDSSFSSIIVSSGKVHSVGECLDRERWPKITEKRLKHVTNDSRLDLSLLLFLIHVVVVIHFSAVYVTTTVLLVSEPDSCCIVNCTKANTRGEGRDIFVYRVKKSHISWRHKHVFNISASKQDKLRFNQLWKCIHVSLHVVF